MSKSKSPFSNGSQYSDWLSSNCERCKKYDYEHPELSCELENAIGIAAITDGKVTQEIYKRMGAESGNYIWMCPEVDWTEKWKKSFKKRYEMSKIFKETRKIFPDQS